MENKISDELAEKIITALAFDLEDKIPAVSVGLSYVSDQDKIEILINKAEKEIRQISADINEYINKIHMSVVYEISTYWETQGLLRIYGFRLNNLLFEPEMFAIPETVSVYPIDSFASCRLRYATQVIKNYFDEIMRRKGIIGLYDLPKIILEEQYFDKDNDRKWTTLTCEGESILNPLFQKRITTGTKFDVYDTCLTVAKRLQSKYGDKFCETRPKVIDVKFI